VKTPGVEVGVPGQNGGDVVVAVPGTQAPAKTGGTTPAGGGGTTTPPAGTEGTKPAGGAGTTAEGTSGQTTANAVTDIADAIGGATATAGQ
jgi:hypothetical protein